MKALWCLCQVIRPYFYIIIIIIIIIIINTLYASWEVENFPSQEEKAEDKIDRERVGGGLKGRARAAEG